MPGDQPPAALPAWTFTVQVLGSARKLLAAEARPAVVKEMLPAVSIRKNPFSEVVELVVPSAYRNRNPVTATGSVATTVAKMVPAGCPVP